MTSNLFIPHIIHPTRITSHSKTLIDNIFSNSPNFSQGMSGNLTISISDHLAQFLIIPLDIGYVPRRISLYKRDIKNFDRENFFIDLISIDWTAVLKLENENPNQSFNDYYNTLNKLIDKYMPLKQISQKEMKHQYKPWITKDILSSIRQREKLHKKFINAKDENIKENYHKKYKEIRNQILSNCRKSKKTYFQIFFIENAKNVKNIWKGIKSIINIKTSSKGQPTSLLIKKELISEPRLLPKLLTIIFH